MLIGLTGVENVIGVAAPPVTVTVNKQSGQADPTSATPILFDVVFSEPVTGFVFTDVFFTGSTAGGPITSSVTGGPTSYVVSVTGMTSDGNVVVVLPAAAASSIATGALSQTSVPIDNTVAWVAPSSAAWHDLFVQSLPTDSNGWVDYIVLQYIAPGAYLAGAPATGTKLRLTVSISSASGAGWANSYVGHVATSGDLVDFDGTQVAPLWSGSAGGSGVAGATVVSDEVTYAFNKTKGLVFRMSFNAASGVKRLDGTGTNFQRSYGVDPTHTWAPISDIGPIDDSTFAFLENGIYALAKVEVYG